MWTRLNYQHRCAVLHKSAQCPISFSLFWLTLNVTTDTSSCIYLMTGRKLGPRHKWHFQLCFHANRKKARIKAHKILPVVLTWWQEENKDRDEKTLRTVLTWGQEEHEEQGTNDTSSCTFLMTLRKLQPRSNELFSCAYLLRGRNVEPGHKWHFQLCLPDGRTKTQMTPTVAATEAITDTRIKALYNDILHLWSEKLHKNANLLHYGV